MTQQNNLSLSDYGTQFQLKLFYQIITDKHFLEQIFDILDPSLFSTDALVWLSSIVKEFYKQYKTVPNLDSFQFYLKRDITDQTSRIAIVRALKSAEDLHRENDVKFIQDKAIDFFKKKNFEKVLLESVEELESGNYELIKAKIDDALAAGSDRRLGHDYIEDIKYRYDENARIPITTGFEPLDRYMNGGLSFGELGVILAMSSVGKSWLLIHLALNAAKAGYNVLFYTLEDSEQLTGNRLDSILTGINTHNLKFHIDTIEEKIKEKIHKKLIIKEYPQLVTSCTTLSAHFNRTILLGQRPDIVFIDYGDIMMPTHMFNQDHLNQRQIFDELKSFAQVHNVPVWTASQANREADGQDVVTSTMIGGAYRKVAPSNIILSLSRKLDDKLSDTGRLHIAKNKIGPDGITLACKIQNEKGIFKVYDTETKEGRELGQAMANGDKLVKERLRNKFNEFLEDNEKNSD